MPPLQKCKAAICNKKALMTGTHMGFVFVVNEMTERIMKKFYVDVQFKNAPCFSCEIEATEKVWAERKAVNLAIACGCSGKIKKVMVREI